MSIKITKIPKNSSSLKGGAKNPVLKNPRAAALKDAIDNPKPHMDLPPKDSDFSDEELDEILGEQRVSPTTSPGKLPGDEDKERVELRRAQVRRLRMRGIPQTTIAKYLKVSNATISQDVAAIKREAKLGLQNFDYPLFVKDSMDFYDEIRSIALRMATDTRKELDMSIRDKLYALTVALNAENDKHSYLQKVGLYKSTNVADMIQQYLEGGGTDDQGDFRAFLDAISTRPEAQTRDDKLIEGKVVVEREDGA